METRHSATRLFIFVFILIGAHQAVTTSMAAAPAIKVDQPEYNFGASWTGMQLKHAFTVRNEGDADLLITRIDFAPGCYLAGELQQTIAPRQSTEIQLAVDTREIKGPFAKTATLITNDVRSPSFPLNLRGECKAPIELQPAFLGFGKVIGDGPQQRSISIVNQTDESFEITLPTTEDTHYKYELLETTPGEEYKLFATLKTPIASGRLESNITLKTSLEAQAELPIRIFAFRPSRIELIPTTIALDGEKLRNSPRGLTRVVLCSNNGDKPVKISAATADDPNIRIELSEILAGKSYRVVAHFPQNFQLSEYGSTLKLTTDDSMYPTLQVPIRMALTPGAPKPPPLGDPLLDDRTVAKLVGQKAPKFELTTTEGVAVTNADAAKSLLLLNFFVPGDFHNFEQVKKVEKLRQEYASRGIRIVNVCQRSPMTDVTQERQTETLKKADIKAELVFDLGNAAGDAFHLVMTPTLVALNKAGVIEAIVEGNNEDMENRARTILDTLLSGRSLVNQVKPQSTPARPAMALIGTPAPDFSFTTLDGKKVARADASAHPAMLLNFVAPNCGYCKRQVPAVERMRVDYEPFGVQFFNVGQTMRKEFSADELAKVMTEAGSKIPLTHDPKNEIGKAFKVSSFPTLVLIRRDGQIEEVVIGAKQNLDELVRTKLDMVISADKNQRK